MVKKKGKISGKGQEGRAGKVRNYTHTEVVRLGLPKRFSLEQKV